MPMSVQDPQNLRAYLLGDLSLERQEQIDAWIMSDDEADLLLTAAENDLIDDSLSGHLNARELQSFTRHFLQTPERQRRLQFGRTLQYAIQTRASEVPAPQPLRPEPIRRTWFQTPAFAYAAAALILALAAGTGWSALQMTALRMQLSSAAVQQQELEHRFNGDRASAEALRAQIQAFATALASLSAGPVVELQPGLLRSAGGGREVRPSGSTQVVRFSLLYRSTAKHSSYFATLQSEDGQTIVANLPAIPSPGDGSLVVALPIGLLSQGDYGLKLSGTVADTTEDLDSYYFSVRP